MRLGDEHRPTEFLNADHSTNKLLALQLEVTGHSMSLQRIADNGQVVQIGLLLSAVTEKYEVDVDMEEVQDITTVGDVVSFLVKLTS